jgi:hypothetical protein
MQHLDSSKQFRGTIDMGNRTAVAQAAFQPPESVSYRAPDTIDTFQSYKFRSACNVSSLDLHAPFSPLCKDRASMLTAMSSGGRIGHDAPYMPRGCDMRWFTSEEVCEILGRFDRVVLVGDSMLRHIIGSINILIRKDLGYGAVTDWNFSLQERHELPQGRKHSSTNLLPGRNASATSNLMQNHALCKEFTRLPMFLLTTQPASLVPIQSMSSVSYVLGSQ